MGEENVGEKNEHAARYHGIGAGLAHLYRAALHGITEIRRHTRDDKGKEKTLYNAHPYEPCVKLMLQTDGQVFG